MQISLCICQPLIKHKTLSGSGLELIGVAICHSGSSVPDVQNKEEDIAHLDYSPELPPCLDVQLKIAEALFLFSFFLQVAQQKLVDDSLKIFLA